MTAQKKSKVSLATKFYLMVVLPLIVVSSLVAFMTYKGLQSNATNLAETLRIQAKANKALSLLLSQDDASKAMLIDPGQLEAFSSKKIEAYDEHKKLLVELKTETKSEEMRKIINELLDIDEQKLRPVDTQILEKLFEDVTIARSMYFTQYEPNRKEYESRIRQLASIGSQNAESASAELLSKNVISLLQISIALILGVVVVTVVITLLAMQVERSERNTKSLLAVLKEGLFFFDRTGALADERSQSLEKIVPGSTNLETLHEFITKNSPVSAKNVTACLNLLWNTNEGDFFSDFDSTISFLPRNFLLDDSRIVQLEYRPLSDASGNLEKVVVVATDVTQQLKNEREAITQAERVRKISKVSSNRESYQSFFEEAIGLFKRADTLLPKHNLEVDEVTQIKRDLHTLKGSTGAFEFSSLATGIHDLESIIDEEGISVENVKKKWEQIKDQWKFETSDIEQVLGLRENKDKLSIQALKFERLLAHAKLVKDSKLSLLLDQSLQYSLKEVFSKYESYVDKLTERRSEKQLRIAYTADSSELSYAELQQIDTAFIHIVRNCLDHGIEEKDDRKKVGKPLVGTLQIACYRKSDGWLHFVLKDDGQGVNGDKLAQKAAKEGLWTAEKSASASYQEKIELVFAANLSTKDIVTELSGRGVGMDAVKAILAEIGGTISIYSQPGIGTQFEIDVPPLKTAVENSLRLSA